MEETIRLRFISVLHGLRSGLAGTSSAAAAVNMSALHRAFAIGAALLTVGCAVTFPTAMQRYSSAQPCCAQLADLRYRKLAASGQTLFEIDETAQVFAFDSGKSYVAALELPARTASYTLALRSFVLGDQIAGSHVFYPQVLLLDAGHRVVARHALDGLRLDKAGFLETVAARSAGLMIAFDASVAVDPGLVRYAVIYTTGQRLTGSSPFITVRTVPIILPGLVGAIPTGTYEARILHSPFGRLTVTPVGGAEPPKR